MNAIAQYDAIVMGVSAGGFDALRAILPTLPAAFPVPLAIVQHQGEDADGFLCDHLDGIAAIAVAEAHDKMAIQPATAYLAPAGYHLLIGRDRTFSLSVDARVHHCRPSIDVLFHSAALAYGARLIGVILTGANSDGSEGLRAIKERGGLAVVQRPDTAAVAAMPQAALDACEADQILPLSAIGPFLVTCCQA